MWLVVGYEIQRTVRLAGWIHPGSGSVRDAVSAQPLLVRSSSERSSSLASQLRVRDVRVLRAALEVETDVGIEGGGSDEKGEGDGLARPPRWPWVGRCRTSLWEPVPLGLSEEGATVAVPLVEHHLLLGGGPGAGKSVALSLTRPNSSWDRCRD